MISLTVPAVDLEPFTSYSLNLAAISEYGTGPHSEEVVVKTFEDGKHNTAECAKCVKFDDENLVPSPPLNVSVHVISPEKVLIVWDPPQHRNGIITQYQVTYYVSKDKVLC